MNDMPKAEMFYLTEPSRGVFVVSQRIGGMLARFEISRDQLANFLVDGAAMALRSSSIRLGAEQINDAFVSSEQTTRFSEPS